MKRNKLLINRVIYRPYILTIICILMMSELVSVLCLGEAYTGLLFATFQAVGLFIPGNAIICLLGLNKGNSLNECIYSFVAGYCFNLVEYFLLMLLGLKDYITYFSFIIGIICIIYIVSQKNWENVYRDRVDKSFFLPFIFMIVIFFISMLSGNLNNLVPPRVDYNAPAYDMLYWIGDIIELTKEFPPRDFHDYTASVYNYHYFSAAQFAYISLATKIRPIYLGLYFTAVQSSVIRAFCAYILIKKSTNTYMTQLLGMILINFASGFEEIVRVSFAWHMYHSQFGFDYAFSFFLFFLYVLMETLDGGYSVIKSSITISIIVFVLSGLKVSYGTISIIGLGIICFVLLKKEYKKSLILGLPALGVFVLEYYYILNTNRYIYESKYVKSSGMIVMPIYKTYCAELFEKIGGYTGLSGGLAVFCFIIVFAFLANPFCLASIIYNICIHTRYKKWKPLDYSLLGMSLVGITITIFFSMYGSSNMYFVMASFSTAIIWFILNAKSCKKPWKPFMLVTAVISVACLNYGSDIHLTDQARDSFLMLKNGHGIKQDDMYTVYTDEYQAYEWIRQNTENNDIIAINWASRIPGVFSERYVNDPSSAKPIFSNSGEVAFSDAIQECINRNIDYILCNRRFECSTECIERNCDIVFENDRISIYRIPATL